MKIEDKLGCDVEEANLMAIFLETVTDKYQYMLRSEQSTKRAPFGDVSTIKKFLTHKFFEGFFRVYFSCRKKIYRVNK
jgi:hypothetical protein